jgi:hypothetical protein
MRTGRKQGEMQFNCFHLYAKTGTAPSGNRKSRTAGLLSLCSEKQELRFLLLQCHAPSQEPLLHLVCHWPAEGGLQAFCFLPLALEGFGGLSFLRLWLDSFALGFLVWEAFEREKDC